MKGELEITPEGEEYLEMLKGVGPSDNQKSNPKTYEQYKSGMVSSELTSEKQNQDSFVLTYFKQHGPAHPDVFKEFQYPEEVLNTINSTIRRLYEGTQKRGKAKVSYLDDSDEGIQI